MTARTRILMPLLLVISIAAMFVSPSLSQVDTAKSTHTNSRGPPSTSASTTTSTVTHGRGRQGVPSGLQNAWAHSNMSVVAWAVTHAIFLNGTHGVQLAWIAINASSTRQMIRNVAYNESVVQVQFDHDGDLELSVNSSSKPAAVYADDLELSETFIPFGLGPTSEGWTYNQGTHVLTVFADPSSVTIVYGLETEAPSFSQYFGAIAGSALVVVAVAMMLGGRRRLTR